LTERAFRAQQMCRIQAGQPGAAGKKAAQDEQAYTSHNSIREQIWAGRASMYQIQEFLYKEHP
jgi:hypothetical protein